MGKEKLLITAPEDIDEDEGVKTLPLRLPLSVFNKMMALSPAGRVGVVVKGLYGANRGPVRLSELNVVKGPNFIK